MNKIAETHEHWLRQRNLSDVISAVDKDELQMEHLLEMTNGKLQQWTTQHQFTAAVKVKLRLALRKFKEESPNEMVRCFGAKFSRKFVVVLSFVLSLNVFACSNRNWMVPLQKSCLSRWN